MERKSVSVSWKYFTKKDSNIATCKICFNDYSYKASVSNLIKHVIRKHGINPTCDSGDMTDASLDGDDNTRSDGETDKTHEKQNTVETWNYYEILDSDKFEAKCKVCEKTVSYESMSDLRKHIHDHDKATKDSDDEEMPVDQERKVKRRRSKLWQYFKCYGDKMARCIVCDKKLSYAASSGNLTRHLRNRHPEVMRNMKSDDDVKKVILSANGQLYEVETQSTKDEIDDDSKDPIEMDTVYLEDLEESISSTVLKQSPPKKKPFVKTEYPKPKDKNPFPQNRNWQEYSKRHDFKYVPRRYSTDYVPIRNVSEQVPIRNEFEQVSKCHFTGNKNSIDLFGHYVVSLLKSLPDAISDQLQEEIIMKILTAKRDLRIKTKAEGITKSNKVDEATVTEPAAFTIIETCDETENTVTGYENVVQEKSLSALS